MKKIVLLFVLFSLLLFGCSSDKKTATCTFENESITAYAEKDTIQKVEVVITTTLEELEITEEEFEEFSTELESMYASTEGVTASIVRSNNTVSIFLSSDYTILSPNENATGFTEFVNGLKSEGYTCKVK